MAFSSSSAFSVRTAKKETEPYDLEEDYEEMATYWLHQGFFRTLVAPLDRVKFIMECQTELARGRGNVDMNARVGKSSSTGARVGQKGGLWHSSALYPSSVVSEGSFVKTPRGVPRISSSTSPSSSFTSPFVGSSFFSKGHGFNSSRFEGHSSSSFLRCTPPFFANKKGAEPRAPFSSSAVLARHLSQHEGIRKGLWRGHSVQLLSMVAQSLSFYHLSEPSQRLTDAVFSPHSEMGCLFKMYAGELFTGVVCSFAPYPLEFIRFHLALDVKGLFHGVPGGGTSPISRSFSSFREPKGEICSRTNTRALASSGTLDFLYPPSQRRVRGNGGFFRRSLKPFAEWCRSPNRVWNYILGYPVLRDFPSYFFTGFWVQMAGSALYIMSYNFMKFGLDQCWWQRHAPPTYPGYLSSGSTYSSLLDNRSWSNSSAPSTFYVLPLSGASVLWKVIDEVIAIVVATTIAHPFDVVRRRRMVAVLQERTRYRDSLECIQLIAISEGIRGFYRGLPISIGRMLVMVGLLQGVGVLEQEYFLRHR